MGRTRLPAHLRALVEAQTTGRQEQAKNAPQDGPGRPKQSERDWQTTVLKYAALRGWRAFHDNATNAPRRCTACGAVRRGPRNTAGLPDLILVRGLTLIWVELKAQDGATTPEQRAWIAALREAGQTVFVWRPSDWDTITEVLAR